MPDYRSIVRLFRVLHLHRIPGKLLGPEKTRVILKEFLSVLFWG